MKSILIVTSDAVMQKTLLGLLKDRENIFQVLTAEDGKEAVDIIKRFNIDLVIMSLRMPNMDGFRFHTYLSKEYPEIKVIVIMDAGSPMIKAKVKNLGDAVVLKEPVDIGALTEMLYTELQVDYGGRVRGISLHSFLQMLELEGKTCTLEIKTNFKTGHMFFEDGNLMAAETGGLRGEDAALNILKWKKILIDIDYTTQQEKKEIHIPLMNLLMESNRLLDEADDVEQREHPRVECLVAYDLGDWDHHTHVKNISLDGAYIATGHPVSIGHEIELTLTAHNPPRSCDIIGKVVRRDKEGIGVKFEELSLRQRIMIESLMRAQ